MKTRLLALLIALAVPALSGCGNKGPLVLPQEPVLTEVPETTTPAATGDAATGDATTDDTPPPADATATPPAQPVEPTPPEAPPVDDGDDDGSE